MLQKLLNVLTSEFHVLDSIFNWESDSQKCVFWLLPWSMSPLHLHREIYVRECALPTWGPGAACWGWAVILQFLVQLSENRKGERAEPFWLWCALQSLDSQPMFFFLLFWWPHMRHATHSLVIWQTVQPRLKWEILFPIHECMCKPY